MTKAGHLIHRVRIDRRVKSTDSRGAVVHTWQKLVVLRASKLPVNGRETFEAGQIQGEVTTRWRIRWRLGLDETMRLVELEGLKAEYAIVAPPIEVGGQRDWMDLLCKAGPQNDR